MLRRKNYVSTVLYVRVCIVYIYKLLENCVSIYCTTSRVDCLYAADCTMCTYTADRKREAKHARHRRQFHQLYNKNWNANKILSYDFNSGLYRVVFAMQNIVYIHYFCNLSLQHAFFFLQLRGLFSFKTINYKF